MGYDFLLLIGTAPAKSAGDRLIRYAAVDAMRILTLVALVTSLGAALPTDAHACSCADPVPVPEAIDAEDWVFLGSVVDSNGALGWLLPHSVSWDFQVSAVWKGPKSETARIFSHPPGGFVTSCDRGFEVGEQYLVFAFSEPDGSEERYRTSYCGRTTRMPSPAWTRDVLDGLGEPIYPNVE